MNNAQLQAHLKSGQDNGYCRSPAAFLMCDNGLKLSVQASKEHYCAPRNNEGPYTRVEIGFPTQVLAELESYAEDWENPTETVYAGVPIELVLLIIKRAGGIQIKKLHFVPVEKEVGFVLAASTTELVKTAKICKTYYSPVQVRNILHVAQGEGCYVKIGNRGFKWNKVSRVWEGLSYSEFREFIKSL